MAENQTFILLCIEWCKKVRWDSRGKKRDEKNEDAGENSKQAIAVPLPRFIVKAEARWPTTRRDSDCGTDAPMNGMGHAGHGKKSASTQLFFPKPRHLNRSFLI